MAGEIIISFLFHTPSVGALSTFIELIINSGMGFPGGPLVKSLPQGLDPWVWKIPWGREWQPTPVFLPEEFHGQGRLADYSPWGSQKVRRD